MIAALLRRIRLGAARPREAEPPHFIRSYDTLVDSLLRAYPRDVAMSVAVGGEFSRMGELQLAVLRHFGLAADTRLFDLGCGSGRLAAALGRELPSVLYHGSDINSALLGYARSLSPRAFRFSLSRTLAIPAADASADMASAFSVFTHLKHTETYVYLIEMRRVLRPRGRLVLSFLEFGSPRHWPIFVQSVGVERYGTALHLNEFIGRDTIRLWAAKIGFDVEGFVGDDEAPWGDAGPFGQSLAVLVRH